MTRKADTFGPWVTLHDAVAALPALSAAPSDARIAAFERVCGKARRGLLHLIGSATITITGPIEVCGYTKREGESSVQSKWWSLGQIQDGASVTITVGRGLVIPVELPASFVDIQLESGAIAGGNLSVYFQAVEESD